MKARFKHIVAALVCAASIGMAADDWPMHRGGPQLQGVAKGSVPEKPELRWTFKAGKPVRAGAAIVEGRVFFGDDAGVVHAVSLADGKELWTFKTEGQIEATPLVLEGLVYIGSADGKFYALDAATGAKKWEYETEDKILGGANYVKAAEGEGWWVVVGSYDFFLHCLEAKTGKLVWKAETENYINGTPAVTPSSEVVFGGCDAILHVVSLKDGKPVRKLDAEAYISGSAAIDGTMVYFGNYSNQVFAFDVSTGALLWKYRERNFPYFSSPALTPEFVVIGGRDKRLHCIDRAKGEAKWHFRTRGEVDSSPVICGDAVVVGSGDGRLYCINLADGKERWNYDFGAPVIASPAVADGAIVIGAEDGNLYCFGPK